MFEYDFGEVGVGPTRVNHKFSPFYEKRSRRGKLKPVYGEED